MSNVNGNKQKEYEQERWSEYEKQEPLKPVVHKGLVWIIVIVFTPLVALMEWLGRISPK